MLDTSLPEFLHKAPGKKDGPPFPGGRHANHYRIEARERRTQEEHAKEKRSKTRARNEAAYPPLFAIASTPGRNT